jgi:hypothetical protein
MSASAPRQTAQRNPSELFIKWKGSRKQGYYEYYDKSIEDEKKRNVIIDLSEGFIILDKDLFSITGYDETLQCNIISNEVREMTDMIIVKRYKDKKAEVVLQGTYEQLKPKVQESRIYKYTRSVYVMLLGKHLGKLAHIEFTGANFAQWIKDVENNSEHSNSVIIHATTEEGEKGSVEYKYPTFKIERKAQDDEWDAVLDLDSNILQPYLKDYLARNKSGKQVEENVNQEREAFDVANWRNFKLGTGTRLCELTQQNIREIHDQMVDAGDVESGQFNCVCQSMLEYSNAIKSWKDKKDKSGKTLAEYTFDEIVSALAKVPVDNPARIYLEVGKETLEIEANQGEDDIPF